MTKKNYWIFLLACASWGLTTALMLFVKLRKKTESIPVLILVLIFLFYMNSADLLSRFRIYSVACANRRLLAHQFIVSLVLGFALNSFTTVFGILLLATAVIARNNETAITGIPLIGSFLASPRRPSVIALGLVFQCLGFFTGTVLSIAMISSEESPLRIPSSHSETNPSHYRIVSAFAIGLIASTLVPSPSLKGKIQTFLGSGLIASFSRVVPLYLNPLLMLPVMVFLALLFPSAVSCITSFIPLIVQLDTSLTTKCKMVFKVLFWHASGALLAGYLSDSLELDTFILPYVSKKAIAQEFFFACILSFVTIKKPNMGLLVVAAGFFATAGPDMAHISSSVSLGANGMTNGCLAARLIWQITGSLFGSTLMARFCDSNIIDFEEITSITRTTDGRIISNRVTGI